MASKKLLIPIYPFLIGVYPVLALYYLNIQEMDPYAIWQAVITSVVITAVISFLYLVIFRSWTRAALPASFTLLLIFTYGHVFNLINGIGVAGVVVGRHRNFMVLWALFLLAGLYIFSRLKITPAFTNTLNTVALSMVALILIQIIFFFIRSGLKSDGSQPLLPALPTTSNSATKRDVYYILIDAYSRSDLLKKRFNVDESDFISQLTAMGFFIPRCTQSNYDTTYPSVASSLNMNYLDALGIDQANASGADYKPLVHHSLARKTFEELGYQTVTFKLPHPTIDINDSTYYFDYFKNESGLDESGSLSFQYLFLNTTILRPVVAYLEANKDSVKLSAFWSKWLPTTSSVNSREYKQYQQNVYALESLANIPNLPGRKFVYAHLLITHQPYVFYPDGSFHPALAQHDGAYRDQVLFAKKRIPEILKTIIERSNPKPIIVLQSDHSYVFGQDRVKNINAYYFPDSDKKGLYDTITPVNTFRLIFNTYFGEHFELLPDVSRYVDKFGDKKIHEAPSSCIN